MTKMNGKSGRNGSAGSRDVSTAQTPALPWDHFANEQPLGPDSQEPAIIVGAGLAGCWLARTLAEAGLPVVVLEASTHSASGASSNPAGIVKPFVTRSPGLAMHFYVQAHQLLLERLKSWNLLEACAYVECGVVQLVEQAYPASQHYVNLSPEAVQAELGVPVDAHGLLFKQAGWLNPAALCHALLQHENIQLRVGCSVQSIEDGAASRWQVRCSNEVVLHTSHLTLCTGVALNGFSQSEQLNVMPARGQLSRFSIDSPALVDSPAFADGPAFELERVINGRHYIIPDGKSLIVGATFYRGNGCGEVMPEDDEVNRQGLTDTLCGPSMGRTEGCHVTDTVSSQAVQAYAGVRATTPDRLPLIGPLPDAVECQRIYADLHHGRNLSAYPTLPIHPGLFVSGGLGSRGIVTSPMAASLLADHMTGGNKLTEWAPLVNPARFQIRALKRLRSNNSDDGKQTSSG